MLIGEVARRTGVSARMLRHYESLGLVSPEVRSTGYRDYSAEDIRRIFHVEGLRSLGLSLRQIGQALDDAEFTPESLVADLIEASEERLRREEELLDRLRAVHRVRPSDWEEASRIVELLREVTSPTPARRQRAALTAGLPATTLVEALLHEPSTNVLGALQWSLTQVDEREALVDALAEHLHDDDPVIRLRVVQTLAKLPDDTATVHLLAALEDREEGVRRHASLSLGARGEGAAVPQLIETVTDGPGDVEAAEVLALLAQDPSRSEDILGSLHDVFLASSDLPSTRLRLMQALVELPGELVEGTMRRLVNDPDPVIASMAKARLG